MSEEFFNFYERLTKQVERWLMETGEAGITEVRVTEKVWDAIVLHTTSDPRHRHLKSDRDSDGKPLSLEFHTPGGTVKVYKPRPTIEGQCEDNRLPE